MVINDRIVVDSGICHGEPVIRSTRVPVRVVVGSLAGGMTPEDIQLEYEPSAADIRAAEAFKPPGTIVMLYISNAAQYHKAIP